METKKPRKTRHSLFVAQRAALRGINISGKCRVSCATLALLILQPCNRETVHTPATNLPCGSWSLSSGPEVAQQLLANFAVDPGATPWATSSGDDVLLHICNCIHEDRTAMLEARIMAPNAESVKLGYGTQGRESAAKSALVFGNYRELDCSQL
jgi:hypothetical protein